MFSNTYNIKLLFAPIDNHRTKGVVERLIPKIETQTRGYENRQKQYSVKIVSDVAETIINA